MKPVVQPVKPSKVASLYWLHAWAPAGMRSSTPRVGKWLIFLPLQELDAAWALIARAVLAGELGSAAKTRTASPNLFGGTLKVICVYTHDAMDAADRQRVRRKLRQLGFRQPLAYKTDAQTLKDWSCTT